MKRPCTCLQIKAFRHSLLCSLFALFLSFPAFCQPAFTGGHTQNLSVCENSAIAPVNSYLTISDAVSGKTETWTVVTPPVNGTLSAAYTTTSTGGSITPSGTTYGPTAGYAGNDSFSVMVSDGIVKDTTKVYVTIHSSPSAITGNNNICSGTTSALTNAVSGGTWSSSNTTVATISSPGGVVTAGLPGTSIITYSMAGGCNATLSVHVLVQPSPIAGTGVVCTGHITALSDATGGGLWKSSNISIASVSSGGLVTGVSSGVDTITYKISSGCIASKAITVNPTSPVFGPASVCPGLVITLSTSIGGGTWTSGSSANAIVNPSTGDVTGIAAGSAYITYTLPTGCFAFQLETVNPSPAPISGSSVCIGSTATLSDATAGGTWNSDNTSVVTIDTFTGVASGLIIGTANVTYTLPATGCFYAEVVTVDTLPGVYTMSGGGSYCSGTSGTHIYLASSDASTNYYLHIGSATIGPFLGSGTYYDFGLQTLAGTYTATATSTITGCSNLMAGSASITITPSVLPIANVSSSSGDTICGGLTNNYFVTPVYGGTAPHYEWTINGTVVGIDTAYYSYIPGPGDTIIVRMISNEVCAIPDTVFDTTIMTVIAHELPVVSLVASPGTEICLGSAVTLTPVPVFGGPSPSYFYKRAGAVVGTGSPLHYVASDGDVFDCYMVSDFMCRLADTVSCSITIKVDTPIFPAFSIQAYPPVLSYQGEPDTVVARMTNPTGIFTYQWYVNGVMIAGATSDTFISSNFTYMGNDSVSCMVAQQGICHYNTFNWRMMLNNVGVPGLAAGSRFAVYPNPGKDEFTITGSLGNTADDAVSIQLMDMLGKVVYTNSFTATQGTFRHTIRPGVLPGGMYLLSLTSGSENKIFHIVIEQ
jgi:hypothetical protein